MGGDASAAGGEVGGDLGLGTERFVGALDVFAELRVVLGVDQQNDVSGFVPLEVLEDEGEDGLACDGREELAAGVADGREVASAGVAEQEHLDVLHER